MKPQMYRLRSIVLAGVGVAALASADAALAQEAPAKADQAEGQLAEIVVTAQHRSENLQKVPIAVSVLSGEDLAAGGINGTQALETSVPGMTFSTLAGAAAPRIRGIGTPISGGGNENSVATYVDGVYIAAPSASVMDFNNVSQVAVLKGPQGTLFGRNATGGLIQITTKDPSHEFGGSLDVTGGNRGTYGGNLYLTGEIAGPIASDLSVHFVDQTHGFGKNIVTGNWVGGSRDIALRSKTKIDLGATTVTLAADYDNYRTSGPAWRTVDSLIDVRDAASVIGAATFTDKFDVASTVDPLIETEQWGLGLTISHEFDFAKLVSITAYRHTQFKTHFNAYPVANPGAFSLDLTSDEVDKQFSQEIRLESSSDGPLTWQLGGFYFHSPVTNAYTINAPFLAINTKQTASSVAGFAQATYHLTDATSFTAGLRYTSEEKTIDTFFGSAKLKVNKPTWRLSLDQKVGENTLLYASYNRGFKSGGFDPAGFAPSSFLPEQVDAFEVGLKTELFDKRFRLNGAGFYYDYTNIQLNHFVGAFPVIYNGDSAKVYGLDFDATAMVTPDLTLTGGLSLLHTEFGNFPISYTSNAGAIPLGDATADGKRLPNSPSYQINIGFDYVVHLSSGNLKLNASSFWSGKWYGQPENRVYQDAYNVTNASLTWNFDNDEKYHVTVWGKNLGNTAYAAQLVTQGGIGDYVALAPGRTFGATFGVKF